MKDKQESPEWEKRLLKAYKAGLRLHNTNMLGWYELRKFIAQERRKAQMEIIGENEKKLSYKTCLYLDIPDKRIIKIRNDLRSEQRQRLKEILGKEE